MTPKDCFGIVVRTIGLLSSLGSMLYLYSALVVLFVHESPHGYAPAWYFGFFAVLLLFGLYFLRGAPHLTRFAYPSEQKTGGGADA